MSHISPGVRHEAKHYDHFYAQGGWTYDCHQERAFLQREILAPLGLYAPAAILEIGCGMGFHASLLTQLGFSVLAVDVSGVGIAMARALWSGPTFRQADVAQLDLGNQGFDMILARGMSWYHYELTDVNRKGVPVAAYTRRLFQSIKPGGSFVLQIATDFTGCDAPGGILNNTLDAYISFFNPLGLITHITDWDGRPLPNQAAALRSGRNIVIITRRIRHHN